ncbi:MAG: OmpA family protein, partial [Bacteroidota bacterium]
MKKLTTTFFLFAIFCTCLMAQPINTPTIDKTIATAKELEEKKDYAQALEWYEKAYEQNEDRALLYPIAKLSMKVRDYKKAERRLRSILRRDEGLYPDAKFMYGVMLKMNGNYPDAISNLQEFIVETSDPMLKKKAQLELLGAEMGREMPPNEGLAVEHSGKEVNDKQGQYSPILVGMDKMYYVGFGTDDLIVLNEETEDGYEAKIYESTKSDKGWGKPTALDQKINREGFHNSNVYVTPDGERMFFTRALLEGNELNKSEIMLSTKGGDGWTGADPVEGINGDYIAKNPVVGELFGKEVLFFAANIEGTGKGGFDIYYAPKTGEKSYGDPVNIEAINTSENEETPFYRDGTLYFSSTGYPSLGGYDIFYSTWDGTKWSQPANMGKGFNSSVDDLFFSLDEEGYRGMLVSNREGTRSVGSSTKTCCNDIFEFEIAKITADIVVGTFTNEKKPLKNASVSIVEVEADNPFSQNNKEGNVFNFPLGIEKTYKLVATHPEYFPDSVEVNTIGLKETKSYEHRFYLKKMPPPPPPEPEYDTIYSEQPIELSNIYYDLNDAKILKEAEQDLELILDLMTRYPEMKIELRSHTDARGGDAFNVSLSQARTESARRWLIRKGIARARMEAKGYGETEPKTVTKQNAKDFPFLNEGDILTESYIDSIPDIVNREAAHRLNRRTEFQILEGPKSIQIKRTRLKKNPNQKGGGPRVIQPKVPTPKKVVQNVV